MGLHIECSSVFVYGVLVRHGPGEEFGNVTHYAGFYVAPILVRPLYLHPVPELLEFLVRLMLMRTLTVNFARSRIKGYISE